MAWPEEPAPLSTEQRAAALEAFAKAKADIQAKRRVVDEEGAERLRRRPDRQGAPKGISRERMPSADDAAREVKRLVARGMPKAEAVSKVRDAVVKAREEIKSRKRGEEE